MKLSIIIPVYNAEEFLEINFYKLEKVYELLNEDDFEIIYVNDGSTDNSKEVLETVRSKHENIIILHQENQGSSGARNTGTDIAKGKYIQYLDADDYVDWEKVIPLLYLAMEENLDAVSYRLLYVNQENQVMGERPKQNVPHNKIISGQEALISGFNPSSICVFLFNRKFLNKHKLRITPKITHMDVEFTSRFMMLADKIVFKDVVAYHYLQTENSITRPKTQEKIQKLLSDEIIVANLVRKNIYDTENKILKQAIEKNYNSIVWGLLWRFYKNKNEVSYEFKQQCVNQLKMQNLYPIHGDLKTPFQKCTRVIFNSPIILKMLIKN